MKKIPFMIFIEPMNLGGGLYFVYSKDDEDNCNYLNLISGAYEEGPKVLPGGDLSKSYLEEECKELKDLNPETIEYLKWIFKENGYNPDVLGDLAESIDKLEDIKVSEFENMSKIRESIKIKDDGTLDYDAMTEEEKKKFFDDLYQLYKADAAVFDGASDDGEDLNDLRIDRWNESLKLSDIDVDRTLDDNKREFLNNRKFESIKKVHTWEPGVVRESKFDRYTEEVNPVEDHSSDPDEFIENLNLGESIKLDKSDFETPEMRLMKRPKKLQESAPNFRNNDGDFPLVVQCLEDEALSMPCPECGFNIYDDPDDEGNRTCDECGYVASEEEWEENCVFDAGLADIIEDEISASFEAALRKFGVDDLKYWFVSMKPGYYQGVQVYVEDSEYSIEDDIYDEEDALTFLNKIDPERVKEVYGVLGDDADETDYENHYSFEDICADIDKKQSQEEADKINAFLDYLVKDLGWTKIEKVATFSNGEAVYRKVEKRAKKSNRIKEARLQEGPGAGYDVEFLGIKITNVKIDEIKLDDYNCQYVEFEADIVPGEYDWNAEGYDWRVDGDSDYFDNYAFYQKAKILGGKVTGSCANGYQGWADANATWTIDEFIKEIEGESYDLGIMYGAGYIHSDITSPFEMEDDYGIDKSDERSGYKNSYISTASIELEDPEMLNQIIEDTRYSDDYFEEEEEVKYRITGIDWNVDDEDDLSNLPKEAVVVLEDGGDEDDAIDQLSDDYGFLVNGVESIERVYESKKIRESVEIYDYMNLSKKDLDEIGEFLNKMKDVKHFTLATSTNIDNVNKIKNQTLKDDKYPLDYYSYHELEKYLDAFENYFKVERDLVKDTKEIDSYLKDIRNISHILAKSADESRKIAFDILDESKIKESKDDLDWYVDYVVGNSYRTKVVKAKTAQEACKKAKVKNIIDLRTEDEVNKARAEAEANKKAEMQAFINTYLENKNFSESKMKESVESHDWDDFDKFSALFSPYLPMRGEGETKATQASTAINKLVYKWFNDGDVFDNNYGMSGWCNDISSHANWLYNNMPETQKFLDRIHSCYEDDEYTNLLYDLCEYLNSLDWEALNKEPKVSSVYKEKEPFSFSEDDEDDYYDDDYEDDYEEDFEDDEFEESNSNKESPLKESYGPEPNIWDEELYNYVKDCALDAVNNYIDTYDIALYDGEIDGVSEYVANLFWENEDRDEGKEAVIDALEDPDIFDANIPYAIEEVVGDYILDDPIGTRDYLLRKEEVTALDKEERFILQDLIQRYGRPDEQESLDEAVKIKPVEVKFYTYAASYFINGDASGLSDDDLEECEFFEDLFKKKFKTDRFNCADALDDSEFGYPELPIGNQLREYTKGHEFLRGDVCTYVFIL